MAPLAAQPSSPSYWPSMLLATRQPATTAAVGYWPSTLTEARPVTAAADASTVEATSSATPSGEASFTIVEVETFEHLVQPPPNLRPGFHCEVIHDSRLPERLQRETGP